MTDDWRPEAPIFTLHRDDQGHESVTVDQWSRQIEVDEVCIRYARHGFIQRDGDTLTLTVDNGRATYRIVDPGVTTLAHRAVLVSCTLQQESAP